MWKRTRFIIVGIAFAHAFPASTHAVPDKRPQQTVTAPGDIRLSSEQIAAAKLGVAVAGPGDLVRFVTVPGNVVVDPDRLGHVPSKVIGTVVELRKRLGDPVQKGEVVALLDSREVADAKSEFLTSGASLDLQSTLFEREKTLWERKISPEQQYLRAENAFSLARLRHDLARQKLSALDIDEAEITDLPNQPISNLRRYALRSPLSGRVIERRVDLGAPVGGDQQEKEIYVIADFSSVWIDLIASPRDLTLVREGDRVDISDSANKDNARGRIIFISPTANPETRSVRVVVSLDNPAGRWRPGAAVTANLPADKRAVAILIPRSALQTIDNKPIVFSRTLEGFHARTVEVGAKTEDAIEILSGLRPGEEIATTNAFILKSELTKSKADE
jgi:membrane fusion protein, heavy metal efflux system